MEQLYAEFLLWLNGFNASEKYEILLHNSFMNNTSSDILLDLEECSSNILDTKGRFMRYWTYECSDFDDCTFGRSLFSGLKLNYEAKTMCIEEFGKRCYQLWNDIPSEINGIEPFFTLNYADDCLSWGDEAQTRTLYEKAFKYYN